MDLVQMDLFSFAAQQAAEVVKELPKVAVPAVAVAVETVREQPKTVMPILDNFFNDGKSPMPTARAARIEANLKAIRLLKESRDLEYGEQTALSQFTGWGGLTEVFLPENRHHQTLKDLLSDEEYRTAQSSVLDSYYTPENLIDFMWDIVRKELKIKSGKVAELGAGTGNFIGYAPMQSGYRFTAVEVDKVSGGIMKTLYPKSDIRIASLEKVKLAADYDLVIGNVPFGQTGLHDRQYSSWNLHNYFIARALDCLKPNGYAVLLTSSATLDSNYTEARKVFAKKAGLVKAYRLPKNTFAGTEIVADILVFQKVATAHPFVNLKAVQTGDDTGEMEINEYFAAHPEHVFGILSNTGKMYGKLNTPTVLPGETTLAERIALLFDKPAEETMPETDLFGNEIAEVPLAQVVKYEDRTNIPETETVPEYCREYSIFSTLDANYQVIDGVGQRMKDRKGNNFSLKETQKICSFVKIKECLNELIDAQLDFDASDETIEKIRTRLRCLYNDHVAKYGVISNKLIHKFVA